MKILNMYCSMGGNTEKIAMAIEERVKELEHDITTLKIKAEMGETRVDFLDYDFLFIGCGVYSWLPPKPMMDFVEKLNKGYMKQSSIKPGSPRICGKSCVTYATFGGPHTGSNEAVIIPKYLGQLPDHLGFEIVAEWLFPGAFTPSELESLSKDGRMGDISGRPNKQDLNNVKNLVEGILTLHNTQGNS